MGPISRDKRREVLILISFSPFLLSPFLFLFSPLFLLLSSFSSLFSVFQITYNIRRSKCVGAKFSLSRVSKVRVQKISLSLLFHFFSISPSLSYFLLTYVSQPVRVTWPVFLENGLLLWPVCCCVVVFFDGDLQTVICLWQPTSTIPSTHYCSAIT